MDDVGRGGSRPPRTPPVRRSSASPSGRFLNHHQLVEPLKTKFLFTSRMRAPKKKDSREKFLYVFWGSKAPKLPPGPVTRILDFDPTPLP